MIENLVFEILQNDLLNIQIANGFENDIKAVYEGERLPSQIPEFPSVCIEYDMDILKEESARENNEMRVLPIIIYILYSATPESYIEKRKSLVRDFEKVFYRSKYILSDYHSHLKSAGLRTEYKIKAIDPKFVEFTQTIGTIGIRIELEYFQSAEIIDSYSFSLTSIPTADSRFTLTSDFASATSNLESQIQSISGIAISGINAYWGTIYGSLSAQGDLWNELESLSSSITGIDLSGYMLNSLSSGFSASSHNHSYNNLLDLPNMGAYSVTSHQHSIYATSGSLSSYMLNSITSLLVGNGTSTYPSFSFTASPNAGVYSPGSNLVAFAAGMGDVFGLRPQYPNNTIELPSTTEIRWTSAGLLGTQDLKMGRTDAATLGLTGSLKTTGNFKLATDYSYLYLGSGNNYIRVGNASETSFYFESCNPRMLISAGGDFTVKERGYPSSTEWMIVKNTGTYINPKLTISGDLVFTGKLIAGSATGYSGTITAGTTMVFTNGILTSIS